MNLILSLHFKLHALFLPNHKRKLIPIKNPNKNQRQSSGNTRGTRWHRPHFECSHTHKGNGWKLIRHMTVKSLPLRFFPKMIASCLRNLTGQGRIANWRRKRGEGGEGVHQVSASVQLFRVSKDNGQWVKSDTDLPGQMMGLSRWFVCGGALGKITTNAVNVYLSFILYSIWR